MEARAPAAIRVADAGRGSGAWEWRSFYGGWVTPELVGPFKGEPGTGGW